MEKKRINFAETEKELLLSLVSKNSAVIDSKNTNSASIQAKRRAWDEVENAFNCSAITGNRSAQQLKVLYDNLKRKGATEANQGQYNERLSQSLPTIKREFFQSGNDACSSTTPKSELEVLPSQIRDGVMPLEIVYGSSPNLCSRKKTIASKPSPEALLRRKLLIERINLTKLTKIKTKKEINILNLTEKKLKLEIEKLQK